MVIGNEKHEARNPKQIRNSNVQIFKTYCFDNLNFCHLILFHILAVLHSSQQVDIRISDLTIYY